MSNDHTKFKSERVRVVRLLSKEFKVCETTVYNILTERKWKHARAALEENKRRRADEFS